MTAKKTFAAAATIVYSVCCIYFCLFNLYNSNKHIYHVLRNSFWRGWIKVDEAGLFCYCIFMLLILCAAVTLFLCFRRKWKSLLFLLAVAVLPLLELVCNSFIGWFTSRACLWLFVLLGCLFLAAVPYAICFLIKQRNPCEA